MKPDADTVKLLRGIQTEIGAGMVFFPRSPEEFAHNNACERANKIIGNYMEGYGLFQMPAGKELGAEKQRQADQHQEPGTASSTTTARSRSNQKKRKTTI